jgi:hypothetical protein
MKRDLWRLNILKIGKMSKSNFMRCGVNRLIP